MRSISRRRKFYKNNQVIELCFRVQQGLPFVPNPLINMLLKGILARALSKYELELCHIKIMPNHVHLMLYVIDPHAVPNFCRDFKQESSHMINRLLSRRQRSNWVLGNMPIELDGVEKIQERISYFYANSTEADLEESIERYPGISSWNAFIGLKNEELVYSVSRDSIPQLADPALSINEAKRIAERLKKQEKGIFKLRLKYHPNAWMKAIKELRDVEPREIQTINNQIVEMLRVKEGQAAKKRKSEGKSVVGSTALQRQSMAREYSPKKFSYTKRFMADTPEKERSLAVAFYEACCKAQIIYQRWKEGELHISMPIGLIAPRPPCLVSHWGN